MRWCRLMRRSWQGAQAEADSKNLLRAKACGWRLIVGNRQRQCRWLVSAAAAGGGSEPPEAEAADWRQEQGRGQGAAPWAEGPRGLWLREEGREHDRIVGGEEEERVRGDEYPEEAEFVLEVKRGRWASARRVLPLRRGTCIADECVVLAVAEERKLV